VVARSTDPRAAQATADAQVAALVDQSRAGKVGLQGLIDVQLVQRAQLPIDPVSPRPKVTMFVALVLGLGFGVGAALLHDNLRRTVDTPDVVSSIFGAPAFGELPLIRGMQALRSTADLGSDRQLRVLSEGLRDISTSLQLSVDEYSSLLVTSPQGSHGKSTVAFGLAVSLARSGANTLLVDADMRRGRVEDFFITEGNRVNKAPGLVDVLRRAPIERIIQRTDLPNLHVLTSGELTDSPGELLDAQFGLILPELTRRFDTVIIDGTPLLPINDARVIAKLVDVVLVVVSEGALTRREVRAASDRLRVIQVEPSAVVLNRSKVRRKSGYYAYLSAGRPRTTT
jgi:capsular exopolysaccharide synthesis family protein